MHNSVINAHSPKTMGTPKSRPASPCVMVIFGATGDLTARKLVPSLCHLRRNHLLPDNFAMVGVARSPHTDESFRKLISDKMKMFAGDSVDAETRDWLLSRIYYTPGAVDQPETYRQLKNVLDNVDELHKTNQNYFFYLSMNPAFFADATRHLGEAGLVDQNNGNFRRVIYEKPFGHDLKSAQALNKAIKNILDESQIYRIDHYLGKETVQNLLVFRFGNGIFEPIWNRQFINHVQISVSETVGVEKRGEYFDAAGTLRDMVPNHICQLLSLTAMEPPNSFQADVVRDEQAKLLNAVQPIRSEDVLSRTVRGQYGEGEVEATNVTAYRSEPFVAPDSKTETFAAMKLNIDNWRWAGVPFYLRVGKRMPIRHSEVAIQFHRAPFMLFRETEVNKLKPNFLVIHIAPDEGISLRFSAKVPGMSMELGNVNMNFRYTDYFEAEPNTGYEVLIYDCMIGDQTLFQRADMVEAGWSIVDPVLDVWSALPARNFPNYAAGSWGPKESEELIERDGRKWRNDPE